MRKFYYYTPILLQKVGYVVFGTIYGIFLKIEVVGHENLQNLKRPVIIAANHTHEVDVTFLPFILGWRSYLYPVYYVSNSSDRFKTFGWRSYFYGGVFFNMLGGYSIHPGFHNYAISVEDHVELLRKGRTVFIFPEGKRTLDGNLNPGRGGLGYLVHETGAIVVPVAIDTLYNISWSDFLLRRREVKISILKPMYKEELINMENPTVDDYRYASQIVMDKIKMII
jgi:1-acyl-sn-glycerol-3-phosphate acyltransferase